MNVRNQCSEKLGVRGLLAPLLVRNFRLLWVGETVSVVGDQFYFVALPWLVLQLNGSGLALGSVLMAAAVPRTVLVLAGGLVTDRFSPRSVMLVSNAGRWLIVTCFTVLTHLRSVCIWHLYAAAAAFGTFDAFFYPAYISVVPSLLHPRQIKTGNSLMQGSAQAAALFGPLAAGIIISHTSLVSAFGFDSVTFLVSITMLALIRTPTGSVAKRSPTTVLDSITAGLSYALKNCVIRRLVISFAFMNLFLTGPFAVGVPVLAKERFGGAGALGLMLSSFGAGSLTGTIFAGQVLSQMRLGPLLAGAYITAGLVMISLGVSHILWLSWVALILLGLVAGFSNIQILAYLHRETRPDMMGRVMSLIMFCGQTLIPASYILAGAVSKIGVTALFIIAGVLIVLGTGYFCRAPEFWHQQALTPGQ
jgi:MFS family permease